MFSENPALFTLLQIAVRSGKEALKAANGECPEPRVQDYPDPEEDAFKSLQQRRREEFDEIEEQFLDKHERRDARRDRRRSAGKPKELTPAQVVDIEQRRARDYADDFLTDEQLVEDNLRVYQPELHRDVVAARKRWLTPSFQDPQFDRSDAERLERFVQILEELLDEGDAMRKASNLKSCCTLGFPGYGLTLEEMDAHYRRAWDAEARCWEEAEERITGDERTEVHV